MSTYLEELSLSEAEEVKRTIRDLFPADLHSPDQI